MQIWMKTFTSRGQCYSDRVLFNVDSTRFVFIVNVLLNTEVTLTHCSLVWNKMVLHARPAQLWTRMQIFSTEYGDIWAECAWCVLADVLWVTQHCINKSQRKIRAEAWTDEELSKWGSKGQTKIKLKYDHYCLFLMFVFYSVTIK